MREMRAHKGGDTYVVALLQNVEQLMGSCTGMPPASCKEKGWRGQRNKEVKEKPHQWKREPGYGGTPNTNPISDY